MYVQFVSDGKTGVNWMKDGHPIRQDNRIKIVTDKTSSKLKITETDVDEDEGLYICYITNEVGEVNTSAELLVEGMFTHASFNLVSYLNIILYFFNLSSCRSWCRGHAERVSENNLVY